MMRILLAAAIAVIAAGTNRTVVVTGATGRSGSLTYLLLKKAGVNVRGLVRNTTKARQYLGCSKCDESEGIFVGDITDKASLSPAMAGADGLVITTGSSTHASAKDILFDGVENQVSAFLASPGPKPQDRHVGLISMQFTTLPDTFLNKLLAHLWGGWDVGFYSLQGEATLMSADVPFTIIKACGLEESPPMKKQVLVGHNDKGWSMKDAHTVSRGDVARVLAEAALNPTMAKGLRMDFCAKDGDAQSSMDILKAGMQPWDPRKTSSEEPIARTVV
jgi:uncharacterized protein YbjT (DUF2867 family)